MNLYAMRHGTTVWNENGLTQGRSNNRLSRAGKAQTEVVATKLKDVKFDVIFCSPLMRTVQTANIVNKHHNSKIIKNDLLNEIDQGVFTGRKFSTLSEEEKALKKTRSQEAGMESYESCFTRIKKFVEFLKGQRQFENVLVVTHNVGASFIEDILQNRKVDFNDQTFLRNFKNAEVKKFLLN